MVAKLPPPILPTYLLGDADPRPLNLSSDHYSTALDALRCKPGNGLWWPGEIGGRQAAAYMPIYLLDDANPRPLNLSSDHCS